MRDREVASRKVPSYERMASPIIEGAKGSLQNVILGFSTRMYRVQPVLVILFNRLVAGGYSVLTLWMSHMQRTQRGIFTYL
jgi:hypothetical protein